MEKQLREHQGQRRRERRCSRCQSRASFHGGNIVKQMDILKELCTCGKKTTGAEEKHEEEEVAERNFSALTVTPSPCIACRDRGVQSEGVKSSLGNGEERVWFNVCISVSDYPNLF